MKIKNFGYPGHFICSSNCKFHLATQIGKYLVSTVGAYYPPGKEEMETIGFESFFETMVFDAGKPCAAKECGCELPNISGRQLDFDGYKTAGEADRGHEIMVKKWAKKQNAKV